MAFRPSCAHWVWRLAGKLSRLHARPVTTQKYHCPRVDLDPEGNNPPITEAVFSHLPRRKLWRTFWTAHRSRLTLPYIFADSTVLRREAIPYKNNTFRTNVCQEHIFVFVKFLFCAGFYSVFKIRPAANLVSWYNQTTKNTADLVNRQCLYNLLTCCYLE